MVYAHALVRTDVQVRRPPPGTKIIHLTEKDHESLSVGHESWHRENCHVSLGFVCNGQAES